MLAGFAVPGSASATPGDMYVLDIAGRGGDAIPGRIIQVDPATGSEIRQVPVNPPAEPLHAPVGIAIDAYGYLIVADTDGYNPTYTIPNGGGTYGCVNGCGAVLRVNPLDGTTQVLSTGPLWSNPSSVVLPPDNNLYDDGGGPEDQLLVLDTGERAVIAVDVTKPVNANQSYVYENYSAVNPNVSPDATPGNRKGLRNPWDFARDPDRPTDLLITNVGVRKPDGTPMGEALESIPGCDDDGDPANGFAEPDGYIARLDTSLGFTDKRAITDYICDPEFRKPRGIVVASGERMFVADPFAAGVDGSGHSQFAGIFQVVVKDVKFLSLGGQLQTPSGLSFTYSGGGVLVADESAFPPPATNCAGAGCGGLLALDPFSGDQLAFSPPGAPAFYRDPIDVAVDRTAAPAPLARTPKCPRKKCCPKRHKCEVKHIHFFNLAGPPASDPVLGKAKSSVIDPLRLQGFGDRARVRLTCRSADCPSEAETTTDAVDDQVAFVSPTPLRGRFRITAFVPKRTHLKTVQKVYVGRFQDFSFTPGPGAEIQHGNGGCLRPGEKKVTKKTTMACPTPDPR
jgi:hypothetical protein